VFCQLGKRVGGFAPGKRSPSRPDRWGRAGKGLFSWNE
jgi:hypothetical protein